jgi:nitrogen regulatory protein PII
MNTHRRKLVTIVTEAALEQELTRELTQLGAGGYTITDARGKGGRGIRDAGWKIGANIRIEVVCSEDLAMKIALLLQERYYDNYAMIFFTTDVQVLRPDKFE